MFGILKAGWRCRRNLHRHEAWVKFYEDCPVPPGVSCAECAEQARDGQDVEAHRSAVAWYRQVMA